MANEKSQRFFPCKVCDYVTSRKSDYNKHKLTAKHILANKLAKSRAPNFEEKIKFFKCSCGKSYKHQSSLCKHKTLCFETNVAKENVYDDEKKNNNNNDLNNLVMKLINENQELKSTLIKQNTDLQKTITEIIPQIGDINSHNTVNKTKFNINVFLNEKCKDALTMNEFIENIEISMKHLLTTGAKGLGEGVSDIIIENMNKLSLFERPMHCTDVKRETLYVKNKEWEKDDKKEQINELLKKIENKQMKKINDWVIENPNYMSDDKLQEEYMNLIKECTGSLDECKNKIIKKLCITSQL